jgi:hypothetical protein
MNMLKLIANLFLLLLVINVYGQTSDQKKKWENELLKSEELSKTEYKYNITKYDFSPLWTKTENSGVYGFIGDNYQRLRIKIVSATKVKNSSDTYLIVGKSMVKNNICDFTGTIKITKARTYKKLHWGVDDEYKNKGIKKQGIIIAEYNFEEDRKQTHSGVFDGLLSTSWYIDKNGKLKYDDIRFDADGYGNNQFVGTWRGYKSDAVKTANWGDYRIPMSGDFDIGAGEFSPDNKYLQFGWQTYHDANFNNDKQARQEEEKEWWK